MSYVLSFVLGLVVPGKVAFSTKVQSKLWRVNVLPECVASLTTIPKTKHTANTGDVKIIKPVVLLHSEHR
jgi:hypothetical protein